MLFLVDGVEEIFKYYGSAKQSMGLIKTLEDEFRQRGVVVVGWPISPMGKLYEILKTLGYAPDDVVMEKRICALPQQS